MKAMTDAEAIKLIGERAEAIANNKDVREKMANCYAAGMTKEEIQSTIYNMAIATLFGMR